ncbi:ATP-binding protein [Aquamicrobium sp.]|uniref:ATP-binding protein n=1 Tax=Aquamicrobium sp. TaxID=1872579 RepID=UPI00349EC800
MRPRRCRSSPPFAASRRTRTDRPERRVSGCKDQAGQVPGCEEPDTFDFTAIPSLNKMLVLELARCEFILRRENIIALGNSGTGNWHGARPWPCRLPEGLRRRLHHRGSPVHQLMEARDERRLLCCSANSRP